MTMRCCRFADGPRSPEPGVHSDPGTVGRDVGGLLADGVGTRVRGDRDADPTGGKRRGAVSPLLARRRIRTLSHLRGE